MLFHPINFYGQQFSIGFQIELRTFCYWLQGINQMVLLYLRFSLGGILEEGIYEEKVSIWQILFAISLWGRANKKEKNICFYMVIFTVFTPTLPTS
jgi:hypothetical protein